ncbi:MAG: RNA polymerase Rpb6 [Bacteroidota bacterium]|nr:RNA polymerase Rpb6 [Bacteroidota bacterium]
MDYKKTTADTTIKTRRINDFDKLTTNVYETVAMLSKRSDQIAGELKQELYKKIEDFAIKDNSLDDTFENKEQIEVSRFYERLPKPYLIAIREYLDDELVYRNDALHHSNMQEYDSVIETKKETEE